MRVYGWEPVRCYDSFSLAWGKVADIAVSSSQLVSDRYRKILKVSSRACIFQRPFLRGLYSEGLTYGGKFAFQNQLG